MEGAWMFLAVEYLNEKIHENPAGG
ncbi:hypothetical protein CCACVL1_23095 [Corchorus capsularis]|uniref:Uncharacterized protein n=1 Tax=Corchorus capsularis TaxID=210143 RepID=A0A1R3GV86_COCAP|nr:hypothetical protein CCACVL1_23095 [Corchorus capsularis]